MIDELVSVIINVYNGEKFIKKCLDSVVNQTYKNLEILIINDGSTDNTLKICENYKDDRIKIITTENLGLSMSRNIGIDNANGEYLYFVDSDDFIELDAIEYLYNICKKYDVLISTCKTLDIYNYDYKVNNKKEVIKIISSEKMLKNILLDKDKSVYTWNKLIKKELYNDIRFENRIINDMAFTHKIIMKTNKIACSNQIKYFYLKHSNSITGKHPSSERLIDIYNVSVERYNYVNNIYPNVIENNTGMMQNIIRFYLIDNIELKEYLKKMEALKFYKQIFTFKVFKCSINIREKIKIVLFRVSPRLNKRIIDIYLKVMGKKNDKSIADN